MDRSISNVRRPGRVEAFLEGWLGALEEAESAAEAFGVAARSLESLGLERTIYLISEVATERVVAFSNMPHWWRTQYEEEQLATSDPFLRHCCGSYAPTRTGEVYVRNYPHLGDDERAFIGKAADAGHRAGVAIPVGIRGGPWIGGFNLGGALGREPLERLLDAYGHAVRIGLLHTHEVMARGARPASVRLTRRERECLSLLGEGHQLKQIAARLDIAYCTVELHLRSARAKLGAATREQALAVAIRAGLLD